MSTHASIVLGLAAVVGLSTGCGSAAGHGSAPTHAPRSPKTIRLTPGHYTFRLGGRVAVGDSIICVTSTGANAGGSGVPRPGHGIGSSTGYVINVSPSGVVKITCPAHPGNV
jgi:hypothetical protein